MPALVLLLRCRAISAEATTSIAAPSTATNSEGRLHPADGATALADAGTPADTRSEIATWEYEVFWSAQVCCCTQMALMYLH